MKTINKILNEIELHILNKTYGTIESNTIEIKDLSSGSLWKELYKTICSFLNTDGGIIIIGINEDVKKQRYNFTGFNPNDENKIKAIGNYFKNSDGISPDFLTDYIKLNAIDILPFMDGQVCVVYIEKLPIDLKYMFFEGFAYERQITGDHKISNEKIEKQKQLIDELKNATELETLPNVELDALDVDLLNEYIIKLNTDKKVETIKPDIAAAMSFLLRKKFVLNNKPTLLGLLVCGKHIGDLIGGKCELDAYFQSGKILADDKKIFKDNVISLMESGWSFTFSKINVGVSVQNSGQAQFEYPEAVIRETINNALAHRDYSLNRFSILTIQNNEYIEIRNPGRFRPNQLIVSEDPIPIRRIIPIPKAQNPNLADVLKVFNRWEGRGIGMATLVDYALNNQIDIPFYRIYSNNELGLYVQKGQVLDDKMITLFKSFDKFIYESNNKNDLTNDELTVLAYFLKSEQLNSQERFTINLTPDNNHFAAIQKLVKSQLITKLPSRTVEYQLYQINSVFKNENFRAELREIFGNNFDTLVDEYKEILQAIYQYDMFSKTNEINANLVGNYIYFKNNKIENIDVRKFDTFKRTTRSRINKLESLGFLSRKTIGKPHYIINKIKKQSLFDLL